ncbi:Zinc finger MYM-type protein 1 [Merluccius polli]|uniref:Zinc finger MYM-type protein 1 n=1 Tax=Merluccius polli TaxID=89951 RepID=A0AA47M7B1_MERPO|nr:Zinc finger MYM-type protein 1 [Merluccius polli]
MPKKERIQKRKEKERQEAAKSSRPLNAWLKPKFKKEHRPQKVFHLREEEEGVEATPEREDESVEATPERKEALDATPDTEEAIEIPEESTGREADTTAEEAIDEGEVEGATSNVGEEVLSNIALLKYPTDPAHQQAFDLKCNASYVKICPKNADGRSFQRNWYNTRPWLEYSPDNDGMYCFSCCLFLNEEKYSKSAWRVAGLNNWRKGLEKIQEHANSEAHLTSMVQWNTFKKSALQAALDVSDIQGKAMREREKQRNREILTRLIDIILYLARQGKALIGDDESSASSNQGNFLELVKMFSQYDSVLKLHLDSVKEKKVCKKKSWVSLLSNRTQNDLIKALATFTRTEIRKEMEVKIYSILVDETTDVSHCEQVSFVVRYVSEMDVKERFLQVCNVSTTTGEEMEKTVLDLLQMNDLQIENMRGQGYDGAANMSGQYKGLQTRILQHNAKALYVHCYAHCLNLVLVESAKSSLHFITFFNLVEKLYVFFAASSKRHTAFVKCQQDLHPGERVIQLQKLSDTRWACREKALKALNKVMDAVVKVLTDLTVQKPPDTAAGDARMYLNAIDFEFLLCLVIATPVFDVTALASDALQNHSIDQSMAYSVVGGVMDTLSNLRTEEQFSKLFKNATEKAEVSGISIPTVPLGQKRQSKVPAKYKHSSTAATESHSFKSVEEYYRVKMYYPFLDVLSQELHRRFKGDGKTQSFKVLSALDKASNWVGKDVMGPDSTEAIHTLCEFYGGEEEKLKTELRVFHASFQDTLTLKGI